MVNLFSGRIKSVLLIFCIAFAQIAIAQSYSVVTTKGKILYGPEKSVLNRGNKVDLNQTLVFDNPQAMAVLISSNGERFILKSKSEDARDSELMATIKDVLVPMKSMSALTTRGTEDHKIIDLEAMIGNKNFVILGDKMNLLLDEAYYPMDENRFFIFSYFVGKESVNKKVFFEGNKLFFIPERLFNYNDEKINPDSIDKVMLFYRDEIKKDTRLVAAFNPVLLDSEKLKEECKILIGFYKDAGLDEASIKQEINDYLNSFYGKTST